MPKEIPWPENRPLAKRAASSADAETAQPLERRHRVRLADQLYGQIFEQLVSGNLSVGDKLPSENEISERYGVSRPVVREALLRLRADGLVTAHQGLGTFVSHQPAPRLKTFSDVEHVSAYLRAQEVRVALEGDAARRRPCAAPTSSCARSRRRTRPSPNRWRRGACRPRPIWRSTPASPKPAATTSIWACWRAFTIPSAASCA